MKGRDTTRFSLERVRAVLDEFIAASDGTFTLMAAVTGVNRSLNGSYDPYDHGTDGQVRRSLDQMAAGGALVKMGLRQAGPGGEVYLGRQPRFYTPEAYREAVLAAGELERFVAAMTARWETIYGSLSAMGIHPVTERGQVVSLSAATWENLLAMIPRGD